MRFFQKVADLYSLANLFKIEWVLYFGLLSVVIAMFVAVWLMVPKEGGRRNWRGFIRSANGWIRISVILFTSLLVVGTPFYYITSGSHGYCEADGKYHTDQEFIRVALEGNIRLLTYPREVSDLDEREKIITNFMSKNPDCCKVFREWDRELDDVSWMTWNSNVVVRVRNEKSLNAQRRGETVVIDDGKYYATVNNCLRGSHVIIELIPGG